MAVRVCFSIYRNGLNSTAISLEVDFCVVGAPEDFGKSHCWDGRKFNVGERR